MTSKPTPPMMHYPDDFATEDVDHLKQMAEAILCGDLDDIIDNMQDPDARALIQSDFDRVLELYFASETLPADDDTPCDIVPFDYADMLETAVQLQVYHDRLLAHIGGARRIKVNRRKRSVADFAYNFGQSQE